MRVVRVPAEMPAGRRAAAAELTAALVAATPTEVAALGWPVTTPRELV